MVGCRQAFRRVDDLSGDDADASASSHRLRRGSSSSIVVQLHGIICTTSSAQARSSWASKDRPTSVGKAPRCPSGAWHMPLLLEHQHHKTRFSFTQKPQNPQIDPFIRLLYSTTPYFGSHANNLLVILGKGPVNCPSAKDCYCNVFGLCDLECEEVGSCKDRYTLARFATLPPGWPYLGWDGEARNRSAPEM